MTLRALEGRLLAGARFQPPRWLRHGDVVKLEVVGIGLLRDSVIAEAA